MSERYSPAWVGSLRDRIDYLTADNDALRADRDALLAALEWYADEDNYNGGKPGEFRSLLLWAHDNGLRARAALDRVKARQT